MIPEQLLEAHRALWREAFSLKYSVARVRRSLPRLRFGAFLDVATMNVFYGLKALTGNAPVCFDGRRHNEEFRELPVEPHHLSFVVRGADERSNVRTTNDRR